MAFWRNVIGFVTGAGHRQAGVQQGTPGAYNSRSASPVTIDTALQLSAVWSCVKLISESIASLPINVYDVDPKGIRTLNKTHNLAVLLNGKPNRWQTKIEFFETITYQLVMLGNNYTTVQRDGKGNIIQLIPLMSNQMEVTLQDDGDILYKYSDGKNVNFYAQKTIWQNKLFGNGIIGLSPLAYARNTLGIAQATEDSVSNIYKNGAKPSGVLTIDKVITKDQRAKIKENFAEIAEGAENRLFVLEAGMKYQQVSLSPQDIELLASRRFNIEDICRFFGTPSILVNDTAAATTWGSGIQQIVQGFYKLGLRPYLERYEASMKANLLTTEERTRMDIEFDFNALLRPDMAERIKMYKEGTQGGIITPNESRAEEGWKPLPGGDSLIVQQQMIPLEQIATLDRKGVSNAQQNS